MTSIILLARSQGTRALDVRPLAWALERLAPGLWAEQLAGESPAEARARREAAADIWDELLAEYGAAQAVEGVAA